jgi:DNA helicase-2/ATP-dependent DNA helicase PcrA
MRHLYLSLARMRAVFGSRTYGLRSRFVDEIPRELIDAPERVEIRAGALRVGAHFSGGEASSAVSGSDLWNATRITAAGVTDFQLGEDVVHTSLGDGVITALEPGGIIVVRFSKDGRERKLVAELAPVSRR